jgi:hypothetical protein
MKHIANTMKEIVHPWAFGNAKLFKGDYAWPEFDFDLEESAAEGRENDELVTYLTERLISRTSPLQRER